MRQKFLAQGDLPLLVTVSVVMESCSSGSANEASLPCRRAAAGRRTERSNKGDASRPLMAVGGQRENLDARSRDAANSRS